MADDIVAELSTSAYHCAEWELQAAIPRRNPWGEITVTAIMAGTDQAVQRVPAFWDGGDTWRVRLAAAEPGTWRIRTECSDANDRGLHGRQAILKVGPPDSASANPLRSHGPIQIAPNGRHFEHADGTPFHWFADTWWMQMSERVAWPEDFGRLIGRRVEQGFTVVQTVVGFAPDTTPFDGRDANAGGSPWSPGYEVINPAYFQACDRRLAQIIDAGIAPCILGSWGYHLLFMGKERMVEHWRYLVARYAAWPVFWCLAGEGAMPYYLSRDKEGDSARLAAAWPEVAQAVRESDPWRRPLTLHPRRHSWSDTEAPETLDFHMTQSGHMANAPNISLAALAASRERYPDGIVINAEPPYEGHGGANGPDVQRYSFWSSMLSGAAGFTYGAAGIFQANDRERPTGNRPDGGAFDAVFWDEAMRFPGAEQVAAGDRLLRSLGCHRFETHPEWASAELRWGQNAYPYPYRTFAAGIPGECRLIFIPLRWYHWTGPTVHQLEPGLSYDAVYIDPATMARYEAGVAVGDHEGNWQAPTVPLMHDMLLLLTRR